MKITLGIPTYNRANLWQDGLLYGSILNQKRKPDEIIVVDDNSTDDTETVVKYILEQIKIKENIPYRFFKTTEPKHAKSQASALPDNVIFAEADKDSILVHIDDDGFMDKDFIFEHEKLQNEKKACYYAEIVYIDYDTKTQIAKEDSRIRRIQDTEKNLKLSECWGAAYSIPVNWLRAVGGHNMGCFWMRGSDSRLGCQLHHYGFRTIFTRQAKFFHNDISYFHKQKMSNEDMSNRLSPSFGGYNETIVNGGEQFFLENKMKKYYN